MTGLKLVEAVLGRGEKNLKIQNWKVNSIDTLHATQGYMFYAKCSWSRRRGWVWWIVVGREENKVKGNRRKLHHNTKMP